MLKKKKKKKVVSGAVWMCTGSLSVFRQDFDPNTCVHVNGTPMCRDLHGIVDTKL